MHSLDLAWELRDLILLLYIFSLLSFIFSIDLAIWKEIVCFPITQGKTVKGSKNQEDLAQIQWRKRRSRWRKRWNKSRKKESISRPCGRRRSFNSSTSQENSLLQSMIISCILIEECRSWEVDNLRGSIWWSFNHHMMSLFQPHAHSGPRDQLGY